jgi:hypothetical protein
MLAALAPMTPVLKKCKCSVLVEQGLLSPDWSMELMPTKRSATLACVPAVGTQSILPEVDESYDVKSPCKSITKKEVECTVTYLFQNNFLSQH